MIGLEWSCLQYPNPFRSNNNLTNLSRTAIQFYQPVLRRYWNSDIGLGEGELAAFGATGFHQVALAKFSDWLMEVVQFEIKTPGVHHSLNRPDWWNQ
jgi:hypothetical protein